MTADSERIETEIAHILFMDMVAYTRHSMEEQARLVLEMRELVRTLQEFQRAERRKELISLDLGDGLALVFFKDPIAPVQCAVELARALCSRPHLRLRMGIHSGPVNRYVDINGKENVSGNGINLAQRVMDCGEAGHILLSRNCADFLAQFETWASCIHDIGEYRVKHDQPVHLFNLYIHEPGVEIGNPRPPEKNRLPEGSAVTASTAIGRAFLAVPPLAPSEKRLRVALLYKRHAQPDGRLLELLEEQLTQRGHEVFIDRHMQVGLTWFQEVERQIRSADAVIPLISEASMRSDMLAKEIQIAHEAAQAQAGKPHILPVRLTYTGELPYELETRLKPIQYALWESPGDDERLVTELLQALENPQAPASPPKLEPVGGAVPLDSAFYIVRPTDHEFMEAVGRRDSIVLVKGARQMGKTSLLARGLQQARVAGSKVILTDFQTLNAQHLASAEALFLTLAEMIADQLDLETPPAEMWVASRGPNMNLERYLRRAVLGTIAEPIVWGLDEVDRLFTCAYGSEVFGLFRSWHNRRSLDPTGPWSRLTLAIAYATEAHLFITDMNQSPFNVGTRLTLDDFTQEQVAELNRRYGNPLQTSEEVSQFYALVSGQPYLVRRGMDDMVTHHIPFAHFASNADRDEGLFGDHLRRILMSLSQDQVLVDAMRSVLRDEGCPTPESFYGLRSAGIVRGDTARDCRPRCQLYASYLARHLL
jgi:class 3 adenylate cyclase